MIKQDVIIVLCSVFIPLSFVLACTFSRFKFVRSSPSSPRTIRDRFKYRRKRRIARVEPVDEGHEQNLERWATFDSKDADGETVERKGSIVLSRYGLTPVATIEEDGTRSYFNRLFALASPNDAGHGLDDERTLFRSASRQSGRSHFSTASSRLEGAWHNLGEAHRAEANELGIIKRSATPTS